MLLTLAFAKNSANIGKKVFPFIKKNEFLKKMLDAKNVQD